MSAANSFFDGFDSFDDDFGAGHYGGFSDMFHSEPSHSSAGDGAGEWNDEEVCGWSDS